MDNDQYAGVHFVNDSDLLPDVKEQQQCIRVLGRLSSSVLTHFCDWCHPYNSICLL